MALNPNMVFARALVANLAVNGVTRFVLSPGSRSGPLAHALAEAASAMPPSGAPAIDLHVRIDERSAAFLALGLSLASGAPVAVVTTSGTAVGNLLPAVMEAHHAGVPLLLLTADRPYDLRGTGANQTTDQRGIFKNFVRWSTDAVFPTAGRDLEAEAGSLARMALCQALGAATVGVSDTGGPGPVHLNLQFAEPLGPDHGAWPRPEPSEFLYVAETSVPPLPTSRAGIVIAGHGGGPGAAVIATTHGWPLLAEPSSGARIGGACVPGYVELLETEAGRALAAEAEFVLVVGRPTLARSIRRLMDSAPRLWVARHGAQWREAPDHAEEVFADVPFSWLRDAPDDGDAVVESRWQTRWQDAAEGSRSIEGSGAWGVRGVVAAIGRSLRGGDSLVLGSSGAVRAADAWLPIRPALDQPRVYSNRGLAGIDGTVATALGIALGGEAPVTALMGDITFLYDAAALLIGPRERQPSLRIVVLNDGGGTIFAGLGHASAEPEAFERVFTTPHGASIGAIARAYGAQHVEVRSVAALEGILAKPATGIEIVEAMLEVPA